MRNRHKGTDDWIHRVEAHAEPDQFKSLATPWTTEIQVLRELRRRTEHNSHSKQPKLKIKPSTKAAFKNLMLLTMEGAQPAIHAQSPHVIAVDVSSNGYRVALGDFLGNHDTIIIEQLPHNASEWLERLQGHLQRIISDTSHQIIGVVISVPSTVIENRYAAPAFSGWGVIDFAPLTQCFVNYPFRIENSARLAGLIESAQAQNATGADQQVCLYLDLNSHISGSLTVNGNTVKGSVGTAGEFGHMPLGSSKLPCICGARGCWGTAVSGIGLADYLGEEPPTDPATYLAQAIRICEQESVDYFGKQSSGNGDDQPSENYMRGISYIAQIFGQGIGGLTNALAPDVIILGSLAAQLHRSASQSFEKAFHEALMDSRKLQQPTIMYSRSSGDAALRGAVELGFNETLTPRWFENRVHQMLTQA